LCRAFNRALAFVRRDNVVVIDDGCHGLHCNQCIVSIRAQSVLYNSRAACGHVRTVHSPQARAPNRRVRRVHAPPTSHPVRPSMCANSALTQSTNTRPSASTRATNIANILQLWPCYSSLPSNDFKNRDTEYVHKPRTSAFL
jgi:hypothetical protein